MSSDDNLLHLLPDYFNTHFSGRTLHYVCNIITDYLSLELIQESGGNDMLGIVCTISFERPVNYLFDAWHVFPPKYEVWTHFNRP